MTDDHAPPRNIFPKPRPSDLITVPACLNCNASTSKDEEYFRLKLCLGEQVGDNAAARKNRATIFRSLERPQAAGLRRSLVSDIRTVQVRTPAGIYLGRRLAFDVDIERIFRVVEKTVRGLFFNETGQRLHPGYEVRVHSDDTLRDEPAEVLEEWRQTIIIPLAHKTAKVIGNGTFSYRFHVTGEDPFLSVWALTFYSKVSFLCLTGPRER